MSEWRIISTNASLKETVSIAFDGDALRRMIDEGFVTRETLLESAATKERKRAGQVRGLFDKPPQIRKAGVLPEPRPSDASADSIPAELRSEFVISRGLQTGFVAGAVAAGIGGAAADKSAANADSTSGAASTAVSGVAIDTTVPQLQVAAASPSGGWLSKLAVFLICLFALPIGYLAAERWQTTDERREEREKLIREQQNQLDVLREQSEQELKSIKEMEKTKQGLEDEIKDLISRRDNVRKWGSADIVLAAFGECAVGLEVTPPDLSGRPLPPTVEFIVRGQDAIDAVAAAVHQHRTVVANDPEICLNVAEGGRVGEPLSPEQLTEFRRYYQRHTLLTDLDDGKPRDWLTFVDARSNKRTVGYYVDHTDDELSLYTVDGRLEHVKRNRIIEHTAWKGDFDGVVEAIDEHSFLDISLLRMLEHLTAPNGEDGSQAVAVRVVLDSIDRTWSSQIQDPVRPRLLEPGESIEGTGPLGSILASAMISADYIMALADYEQKQTQATAERDKREALENAAAYLEDRLLQRLNRAGVLTIDHRELARRAGLLQLGDSDTASLAETGRKLLVSHVLEASVKPAEHAEHADECNLTLRLIDCRTDQLLFTDSADQIRESVHEAKVRQNDGYRNWFLDAGDLRLVKANGVPDGGLESPECAPGIRSPRRKPDSLTAVYIEEGPAGPAQYFRPLFSLKRRELLSNTVPVSVESITARNQDEFPDRLRYILCQILRECVPCAGRVLQVSGNEVTVGLGVQHKVRPGDRLQIIRISDDANYLGGGLDEQRLATALRVNRVSESDDSECSCTIIPSGMKTVWTNWNDELREGDLAIPQGLKRPVIGIAPLIYAYAELSASEQHSLLARKKGRQDRINSMLVNAEKCSVRFSKQMTQALQELHTEVRILDKPFGEALDTKTGRSFTPHQSQIEQFRSRGVTHAVGGWLVPVDDDGRECRFEIDIVPLHDLHSEFELQKHLSFVFKLEWLPETSG